jgi:hypothetical protein
VEKSLKLKSLQNSVLTTAGTNTEGLITTKQLKNNVNTAGKNLMQNILKESHQDSVLRIVDKQSLGEMPVYNIEVEEAHCYYANNVLVGNCSGAFKILTGPDRVFKYYISSPQGHFRKFGIARSDFELITKDSVEVYAVLTANKQGQIFGATYVYSLQTRRLRQYGELISLEPLSKVIAYEMQQKIVCPVYDKPEYVSLKKIYCNELMMDYAKGSISKELKKYGLKLHLNLTYDEPGAIHTLNDMTAENRFVVHSSCIESDVQFRGMRYENKKPQPDHELARCVLILVSQLRASLTMKDPARVPEYSKKKQGVREQLRSTGKVERGVERTGYEYLS